jgi:hypothetical protein
MTDTFATVGYDNDTKEWTVAHGDTIQSRHDTKQDAIAEAKDIESVNSVMAFTKGNSNFQTHHA